MSAPESFDPYLHWLGIDPRARPVTHYSLLGLPLFEADAGRIARAADERMTLIRQYQMGPRGAFTQRILNELATARICLLSPVHKSAYDEALRVSLMPAAPPVAEAPRPKRKLAEVMPPAWEGNAAAVVQAPPIVAAHDSQPSTSGLRPDARRPSSRPMLAFVALGGMVVLIAGLGFLLVQRLLHPPGLRPVAQVNSKNVESDPREPIEPMPELAPKAVVVLQEGSGELNLSPATALVEGELAREVQGTREALVGWSSAAEIAEWQFKLVKPGFFELELAYVSHPSLVGKIVTIAWDKETKRVALRAREGRTGGPINDEIVRDSQIILIKRGGEHSLTMQPAEALPKGALQLISIRLIPAVGP